MAKEKFERTKPHVNVGTIGHVQRVEGPGGLTFGSEESTAFGNPPNSYLLSVDAPATASAEAMTVVIPVDDEFFFRLSTGPAASIDFSLDVLPLAVEGTNDVDVSLGIFQGEFYLARATSTFDPPSIGGPATEWNTLRGQNLFASDFQEADGGAGHPDFHQPFQFGYAFTSQTATPPLHLQLGLDNMTVEITTIPEPTSLILAISIGATFLWNRWRGDDDCAARPAGG
jgi:hypothetical protein